MQRHYRPRVNVVQRPTRAGGEGYLLTGHHELMVPLLVWGVLGSWGWSAGRTLEHGEREAMASLPLLVPSDARRLAISRDHLPHPRRRVGREQLQDQVDHEAHEGQPEHRAEQAEHQTEESEHHLEQEDRDHREDRESDADS